MAFESVDKILEQCVGAQMLVSSKSTENTIHNMNSSGLVLNNDLVKSTVTNPDTLAEMVAAASGNNTVTKLGYPPNSPDVGVDSYMRLLQLARINTEAK